MANIELNGNISPREFISLCNIHETQRLVEILEEYGHIGKHYKARGVNNRPGPSEDLFEKHLTAIHGKWNMLSKEEESILLEIGKRFIHL